MEKDLERKKKVIRLIKDLVFPEVWGQNQIPVAVSDYILHEYGLSDQPNVTDVLEDITEFTEKLEDLIKEKSKTPKPVRETIVELETDSRNNFTKACEEFQKAKTEYVQSAFKLASLMNDIIKLREKYSEYVKEKSMAKCNEMDVLESKLQFLKLQSFLKLYGEGNAFEAHLRLREILSEKLTSLRLEHKDLIEKDAKYSELKNNKTYCDLLQTYKQLMNKEKKLEFMIEN